MKARQNVAQCKVSVYPMYIRFAKIFKFSSKHTLWIFTEIFCKICGNVLKMLRDLLGEVLLVIL